MGAFALFSGVIQEAIGPFFSETLSVQISELILITAYSSGLSAMLMLVRKLRPELFQYPYILTFSPFIIIASFLLVLDTFLIKDLIFMSVQMALILVALLLLISCFGDGGKQIIMRTLAASLILFTAYAFFWLGDYFEIQSDFVWQFFAGIGIVMKTDLITSISIINKNQ
ncbi:MAG: hypothetical protein EA360_08725 [Balneolaceae bacterium]|nr:MAG: hypothetical protein EA360_08725 [Balneolaceae bacterium]